MISLSLLFYVINIHLFIYVFHLFISPSRPCARVQVAAAGSPWRPRRPVRQAHSPRTTGNKAASARGLHNKLTPARAPLGPPRHTWWRTEPFSSPSSVRLKSSVGVTNYRSEYWNHCHYRWSLYSLLNKRPRRGDEGERGGEGAPGAASEHLLFVGPKRQHTISCSHHTSNYRKSRNFKKKKIKVKKSEVKAIFIFTKALHNDIPRISNNGITASIHLIRVYPKELCV